LSTGAVALGSIFAVAGLLLAWQAVRRASIRRRLLESGFEACDGEAAPLGAELSRIAPGFPPGPRRSYQVGRCFKRAGGRGPLYRLEVTDVTNVGDRHRTNATGARFDFYVFDLPDPERTARAPLSVFLAPPAPGPLQALLAQLVKIDPHGTALEIGDPAHARRFLAAFADRPGTLDERLPAATQERLARAMEAGFFVAHFGAGKLALAAFPERPDVDRQLAYLAEWA
jgi:hypothetical protein